MLHRDRAGEEPVVLGGEVCHQAARLARARHHRDRRHPELLSGGQDLRSEILINCVSFSYFVKFLEKYLGGSEYSDCWRLTEAADLL